MSLKIRAKILDMKYDKDNNLFKLSLKDLDKFEEYYDQFEALLIFLFYLFLF